MSFQFGFASNEGDSDDELVVPASSSGTNEAPSAPSAASTKPVKQHRLEDLVGMQNSSHSTCFTVLHLASSPPFASLRATGWRIETSESPIECLYLPHNTTNWEVDFHPT